MAVPTNVYILFDMQDDKGFRSHHKIALFDGDVSADATTVANNYTYVQAVATAWAAMSNAKLIRVGWQYDYGYAQEPTSETGTYQLVRQKAHLEGGDGNGGFMAVSVPAPKDTLFLASPGQDDLIVVNPASGLLTGSGSFRAALGATAGLVDWATPRGGLPFAQFFGGQLENAKAPRRRVLQGA